LSLAGVWGLFAYGIWRQHALARAIAAAVLWLVLIIYPLGTINPFAAINDYGPNPPSAEELVLQVLPVFSLALLMLHVLSKHKTKFKWGDEPSR
jgi:hypothetical protein